MSVEIWYSPPFSRSTESELRLKALRGSSEASGAEAPPKARCTPLNMTPIVEPLEPNSWIMRATPHELRGATDTRPNAPGALLNVRACSSSVTAPRMPSDRPDGEPTSELGGADDRRCARLVDIVGRRRTRRNGADAARVEVVVHAPQRTADCPS